MSSEFGDLGFLFGLNSELPNSELITEHYFFSCIFPWSISGTAPPET